MSRSMYNHEWKQEYLKYEGLRLGVDEEQADSNHYLFTLGRYFERISNKETEYGKDLVEMTREEAIDTLSSLRIPKNASRGTFLSQMKAYGKWMAHNGKTANCTDLESLIPANIINAQLILESMIKDPEHFEEIISNGISNISESRQIVVELIMRLLYEGLKLVELCRLKKDNVDEYGKVVTEVGEYQLSDKIRELWDKCAKLTYLVDAPHPNSQKAEGFIRSLATNDYLFRREVKNSETSKENESEPCSESFFRDKVRGVFSKYTLETQKHIKVSASDVRMSGLFYKMLLVERAGVELTNEYVLGVFNKPYKTKNELRTKSYNLLEDYYDWKITFQHNVREGDFDE